MNSNPLPPPPPPPSPPRVAVAPKGALTQAERNYNLLKRQMRHQARQARLENEQLKAHERRRQRALLRQNVLLSQRNAHMLKQLRRNEAKIEQLKQMWNETQYRIRTYEQQLLRDQTNHMLRMQLQVEKQRGAALADSRTQLTQKNNDYILKRNIPCWGCII
jgi:hypothetical protein